MDYSYRKLEIHTEMETGSGRTYKAMRKRKI
jgi:hypothetical protein